MTILAEWKQQLKAAQKEEVVKQVRMFGGSKAYDQEKRRVTMSLVPSGDFDRLGQCIWIPS